MRRQGGGSFVSIEIGNFARVLLVVILHRTSPFQEVFASVRIKIRHVDEVVDPASCLLR